MADQLAVELRTLLRVRRVSDLDAVECPTLFDLAGVTELNDGHERLVLLRAVLDPAIERLGDGPYASAAAELFGTDAWFTSTKERGTRAAAAFGVSYDAFRRRSNGHGSRMEEVIRVVASALAEADEIVVTPPSTTEGSRGRSRAGVFAAVGVLVLAIAGAAVVASGGGDDPEEEAAEPLSTTTVASTTTAAPSTTTTEPPPTTEAPPTVSLMPQPCRFEVGEPAAVEAGSDERAVAFAAAYETAGGPAFGCASEPVTERGGLHWQEIRFDNTARGGLLGLPDGDVLVLNAGQWRSYIRIGGGDGSRSPTLGGIPTGEVRQDDDGWWMELDGAVELLAEGEDGSYFWIPPITMAAWDEGGRSDGRYGRVAGSPTLTSDGLRQDFENGHFMLTTEGELVWNETPDPGAELPAAEELRGRLINANDGTGWLVDDQLRRWWVVDPAHWFCAGGDDNVAARGLSGTAVQSLEFAGLLTCPVSASGFQPRGGGVVVTEYCQAEHADGTWAEVDDDGEWTCTDGTVSLVVTPSELCAWQYGPAALPTLTPGDPYSWKCGDIQP